MLLAMVIPGKIYSKITMDRLKIFIFTFVNRPMASRTPSIPLCVQLMKTVGG